MPNYSHRHVVKSSSTISMSNPWAKRHQEEKGCSQVELPYGNGNAEWEAALGAGFTHIAGNIRENVAQQSVLVSENSLFLWQHGLHLAA